MRRDVSSYRPEFVALGEVADAVVVDELEAQLEQLARGRAAGEEPAPDAVEALLGGSDPAAFGAWVHYPWRHTVVHVLPRELHRELRLDRNRYAITEDEQERLGRLCIAVAGLSVGRAVVSTLAHEGIGGTLRLADFDALDLSNLNRVSGGLPDVGIGKVVLAAREVAELDPYIEVVAFTDGIDEHNVDAFVDGADVLVDECDGLEMKLLLRERARTARTPVVMATSHRGMLDVERFDREPDRPAFHGLLGDVSAAELQGLTTKQKVPYVLRILDPARLTDRAAASLVEVKESISTWPQLASDVALGGAMVASAVRRIALGASTVSGRFYADLDELTADGREVALPVPVAPDPPHARAAVPPQWPATHRDALRFVAACATTAPSGGNMQPWRFDARGRVLRACADPTRSSLLDFDGRATLLALGAALEAAVIGARALGYAPAVATGSDGAAWELTLDDARRAPSPDGQAAVQVLWQRCCNRRTDTSPPIGHEALARLAAHGAPLLAGVVTEPGALGAALGALDRVRFLSTRLREDMLGELRFAGEDARDGIDVASLELDAADRAAIDVLRTGSGMEFLAERDRGWGLLRTARDAFAASGGALVLRAPSLEPAALVDAGRGLMRLWLHATREGLAVHPWGSPFLFQRLLEAPGSLQTFEREALTRAAAGFTLDPAHPNLLVLRVSTAGPPSTHSLRRPLEEVLTFTDEFSDPRGSQRTCAN